MNVDDATFWSDQVQSLCLSIDSLTVELSKLRDNVREATDELTRIRQNTDALVREGQG